MNAAGVKFWLPYKPPPQSLVTPLSRNPRDPPSPTRLNSRQVQTGPQFQAGPDWASIPGSPGFTCPPAPRHLGFTCPPAPRHLGFTCPPAPRHLGFTCPPALLRPATWGSHALLRPATWGSHALLRPATWVHMPSCPPPRHLGSHAVLRPATWVSHALLPSSAPPPGFHMPSCAQAPGFHIALLDRTTTQTTPQSAHKPSLTPPLLEDVELEREDEHDVEPDHTRGPGVSGRRGGWAQGTLELQPGGEEGQTARKALLSTNELNLTASEPTSLPTPNPTDPETSAASDSQRRRRRGT